LGPWFTRKSSVEIRSGEKNLNYDSEEESAGLIAFTISTKDLGPGEFDIKVKSGGQEAVKKTALTITDHPGIAGLGGISIGASYKANIYLAEWKDLLKNSYVGGGLTVGLPFGSLPYVPWNAFTSHFGIDFSVDYIQTEVKERRNRWYGPFMSIPATMNLFAAIGPSDFPLSLIVRAGGGAAYTRINFNKPSPGDGISSSTDFLWQAGGGIRLTLAKSVFFEVGSMYVNTLFKGSSMQSIQGYFTAGILL
jgi:hypothetical protein